MANILISYDLNSPGKNYDGLIEKIKTYSWAKICKSTWAIHSNLTVAQIRDSLQPYLDKNDVLFVSPCDNWASYNLPDAVVKWLQSP
ncbi:MAG: hypothetical protein ACERKO_10560 [Acetanaerobacterium sp.]